MHRTFLLFLCLVVKAVQNNDTIDGKCGSSYCLKANHGQEECGICARTSQPSEDSCMYPFGYRYSVVGNTCSVDLCWPKSCSGKPKTDGVGGKDPQCYGDSYATNACYCKNNYFGEFCNYTLPSGVHDVDIAKGINPIFNLKQKPLIPMKLFIATNQVGKAAVCTLDTGGGDFKSFTTTHNKGDERDITSLCSKTIHLRSYCLALAKKDSLMTTLRFPIINNPEKVLFVGDVMAGYLTTFRMVVDHPSLRPELKEKSVVFNKTFTVFIEYPEDIECTPIIQLSNCMEYDKRPSIPTSAGVQIFANIENPELFKVCETTENFSWKVWRVDLNTLEEDHTPMRQSYGQTELFYPPLSLTGGTYKVEFGASFINRKKNIKVDNFGQCFFRIKLKRLVAIIDGAPILYWPYEYAKKDPARYILANRSYDPNTQSSEGLEYWWGCSRTPPNPLCDPPYACFMSVTDAHELRRTGNVNKACKGGVEAQEYRVYLKVTKVGMEPATTEIKVHFDKVKANYKLEVNCISCTFGIVNPKDAVILQVKHNFNHPKFKWEYTVNDNLTQLSTENIAENGTNVDILKIKENSLDFDTLYTVLLTETKTNMTTYIKFSTAKEIKIECKQFLEGKRVVTVFSLKPCETEESSAFVYEFYDKSESDETLYSGRMLGTSPSFVLTDFTLVRSKFVVYSFDSSKMANENFISVKLEDEPITDAIVETMIANFIFHANQPEGLSHVQKVLRLASAISEVITPEMDDKNETLKMILSKLKDIPLTTLADEKLYLSTLHSVFAALSKKKGNFTMDASFGMDSAIAILEITDRFVKRMNNMHDETTLTPRISTQMIRFMIDCLEVALAHKNEEVFKNPKEYVDPLVLQSVYSTSYRLVTALDKLMNTILQNQLVGDTHSQVESSNKTIYSWVKAGYPDTLASVTRNTYGFPMMFSNELVQSLKTLTSDLGITFIRLKRTDPFWWAGTHIDTDVLMVMFCAKSTKDCEYIDLVKSPLNMLYNITEKITSVVHLEGYASGLSKDMSPIELDLGITVYRLDIPLRARLFCEFLFDNQNNTSTHFKVLIQQNERPDYKAMTEEGQVISPSSPIYNLTYDIADKDRFYYMGVLPLTQKGLPLFEEPREPLQFKVKMYHVICMTWVTWQWSNRGCYVGRETDASQLVCECTHFSMFGGSVGVPELQLFPAYSQPLLLTQHVNLLPLLLVLGLLALFLLLAIWAFFADRKRSFKTQGDVIVLEDNYPTDRYPFLLGVFTGSRINAGTDANVGVKLYGDVDESRSHILKSSLRPTLVGNTDDWFLVYCPRPLGTVENLQVWHDNTGFSPDWFVEKIEVYDLANQTKYLFELNLWLALEMNEFPEVIASPATIGGVYSVKDLFMTNVVAGFRDTHYWTSIRWRHPRNPVTRVERIGVVTCFLMVAMATSIILFYYQYISDWREDLPAYTTDYTEFMIFLVSFICASVSACLVMFIFRKAYSIKRLRSKSQVFVRNDETGRTSPILERDQKIELAPSTSEYHPVAGTQKVGEDSSDQLRYYKLTLANLESDLLGMRVYKKKTVFRLLLGALKTLVQGSPLATVKMPNYHSTIIVKKRVLIFAWILMAVLTLVSVVLVSFYGRLLQPVEMQMWLSIFVAIILFDALILSIIKIILCSAILSLMYQPIVYTSNYLVNPKRHALKHLMGDRDYVYQLLTTRCKRIYCPLPESEIIKYRTENKKKVYWRKLLDFVIVLSLILVLVMLSFAFTRNNYASNQHNRGMVSIGHKENVVNFMQISNRTDFEMFIKYKFIRQLHTYMWYNLDPLVNLGPAKSALFVSFTPAAHRKEWTDDCVTRLLGTVRMRQLRVAKGACTSAGNSEDLWNLTTDCSAPWSESVEDKGVYDIRWSTAEHKDVQRTRTDWKWTAGEYSNSSIYYGRSATLYHAGGFISDLGHTKQEAEYVVAKLIKDHWLDHYTRAVFVELTLYNVNTGLFSQLALITEQTPFGLYLPLAKVQSVSTDLEFNFWNISFIVFLIFFLLRMIVLMNRIGIFTYLSNNLNVYEVFLLVLGFCTVIFYIIHVINSSYYMNEFQRGGMDQFFNFFKIVYYSFLSKAVMCLLIACVVVRMFISWHFGHIFTSFYYTFRFSWSWIIWLQFSYIIAHLVTWRFVGYYLNIFTFSDFNTITIYYKDFSFSFAQSPASRILVYCMCILSLFVILLYISSFAYYYRIAKAHITKGDTDFNYITFSLAYISQKIKRLTVRSVNK